LHSDELLDRALPATRFNRSLLLLSVAGRSLPPPLFGSTLDILFILTLVDLYSSPYLDSCRQIFVAFDLALKLKPLLIYSFRFAVFITLFASTSSSQVFFGLFGSGKVNQS
jgi:hypothetical protein